MPREWTTAGKGIGILLVLLTAVISGVSIFVNSVGVQGTNSDAFVTVRNGLVAVLLVPMVLLVRRDLRVALRRTDWARLAAIGVIGGAVPFLLFFRGIQMATAAGGAATASFGYRTLFIMATVLGVLFLKEKFSARIALAAGLLLVGNALLLSLTAPIWTDGTALVLAATALWAGEYTLSKRTLRDLPSSTVALGRMGFGGLVLFGYLAVTNQLGAVMAFSGPQLQMMAISTILLLGFVTTWYAGLKHVDVSVATAVLVLGFPITFALSALAGKTAVTASTAAGAAAVAFGVCLAIGMAALRNTWTTVVRLVVTRAKSTGSR